jgi:hypothetical protein
MTNTPDGPISPDRFEIYVNPVRTFAAAYVDGVLAYRNDYDEVMEWVIDRLGLIVEHGTNAFYKRSRIAPTVADIPGWHAHVDEIERIKEERREVDRLAAESTERNKAKALREQAAAMLAEAERLDGGAR